MYEFEGAKGDHNLLDLPTFIDIDLLIIRLNKNYAILGSDIRLSYRFQPLAPSIKLNSLGCYSREIKKPIRSVKKHIDLTKACRDCC